ncbi:MAG: ABC transporter ATP-binding protein [Rhodothermales bacterium]|nr:ABC transporter ATP-binding protein [Rhodothermales bacterium]MBO6780993.1 ABC transporter ATP-binding protein [Rhodothermales bacterium]
MEPLLSVRDLKVGLHTDQSELRLVRGISFDVHKGQRLGIAGESGSGKSLTLRAIQGLLQPPFYRSGSLTFIGEEWDLSTVPPDESPLLRASGGAAMVFQEAKNSLSPYLSIGRQALQLPALRGWGTDEAGSRVMDTLGSLGLRDPERVFRSYPHQLSGGECQRVATALGLLQNPVVLLADEPTTQLDALVQVSVLDAISRACPPAETALVLVSHDLAVLGAMVDRIVVMRQGELVDGGTAEELLIGSRENRHPYTLRLRDAYAGLAS